MLERLPPAGVQGLLDAYEREVISAALHRTQGNQSAASRLLGMSERRLRSRLGVLEIGNLYRS